jgi:chemotaxis protein MotB
MKTKLLVCLLLTAGCVTQGKYDDLNAQKQKEIKALSDELGGTKKSLAETQQALKAEQEKSQKHSSQAKDLDAKLSGVMKDKSQLQASVDEMRTALEELGKRKAQADSRVSEFKSLLDKFKSLIDSGKLKVKIVDGRMVVILASDILFPSGSAKLSKEGLEAISEVGKTLASIAGKKFQIEGHTDNIPIKTSQYPSNWNLAAERSITVLKTMIEAGMPTDRISAASFADSKPSQSNETKEGRSANRRIEIVVVPDLSTLPGFEELNKASAGG